MSQLAKSVEFVELYMPGTTGTFAYAELTKGQVIENCVPFVSWYCANDGHDGQFFDCYFTDLVNPTINVQREVSNSYDMYIKAYVVEFDPEKVKVYQGEIPTTIDYGVDNSVTVTASGTYFDQSKTAMVFNYRVSPISGNTNLNRCLIKGKVNSDGESITFNKGINITSSYVGHYYLFESIDNDFTVQHTTGTWTGDTGHNVGVYDWHNTFVLNSYYTNYDGTDVQYCTARAYLWGNSLIATNRSSSSYTCYYTTQKIEFNNEATASGTRYCPKITSYHSMNSSTTERTIDFGVDHVQASETLTMVSTQNPTRTTSTTSYKGSCYNAVWWAEDASEFYIKRAEANTSSYPTYYAVDWNGQPALYPDTNTASGTVTSGTGMVRTVENITGVVDDHVGVFRLSKGQDVSNCVVFRSGFCTNTSAFTDQYKHESLTYFRGNELYVERGNEGWVYNTHLSVVEFYPDQVRVQQGHFYIDTNALSTTVTLDHEVVLDKTFLVFGVFFGGAENTWGYHLCRGYLSSSTTLLFERGSTSDYPLMGYYYLAEDLQDWWTVTHSNSGWFNSTVYNNYRKDCISDRSCFALVSTAIEGGSNYPYYGTWRTYYHGPIHFKCDRHQSGYNNKVSLQVVSFNDRTKTRSHYYHANLTGYNGSLSYSPHAEYQGMGVTPIFTNLASLGRTETSSSSALSGSYMLVAYDEATNTITVSRNTNYNSSYSTMNSTYTVCWEGFDPPALEDKSFLSYNSFIKSIERFSYQGTNRRTHFYLTKNQTKENCVPIMTYKVLNTNSDIERYYYTMWFDPSTNDLLKFEAFWNFTDGGIDTAIDVLEFDPTKVNIQQGYAWLWSGEETTTVDIDVVDTTKAFIISYPYITDGAGTSFGTANVANKFNSSTQLYFRRETTAGYLLVVWYVVECLQDQWDVQYSEILDNSATYNTSSIDFSPEHGTIPFVSYCSTCTTYYPYYALFRIYPNSDQRGVYSITANRQTAGYSYDIYYFTLALKESLGIYVDHIHFYFGTSVYEVTVDLGRDYDVNTTVIWSGQSQPHMRTNTSSSSYIQSGFFKAVLQDSRTLLVTRSTYGSPPESWGHVFLIEFPMATHKVSGVVREKGSFVSRDLRLHSTATGEVLASTTSSGVDGAYSFYTTYSGSTYVVCFDDDEGTVYNGLISTDVYPTVISGTFPYEEGWV
jgi:hypothetical protein